MRRSFRSSLILLVVSASPLSAQELSDEELLQRFEAQRDAFREAREGGLGATRGLELITVDDLSTDPELASEASEALAPPGLPSVDESPPVVETEPARLPDPGQGTATAEATLEPDEGVAVAGSLPLAEPAAPDAAGVTVAPASEPVVFGQLAPELMVNVRVTFPFDSAVLTEDQLPQLDQLCRVMRQSDIGLFRIVGHTDAAGTDEYNERLSLLRAEEVKRYFVGSCGLDPSRLEAVGMGERFLVEPADPRAADNRRVEFQALS